jgi:hypothetical protein
MTWVKLTPSQAAQLDALTASNAGPHRIASRADVSGAKWIGADLLGEPLYAHYSQPLARARLFLPTKGVSDALKFHLFVFQCEILGVSRI